MPEPVTMIRRSGRVAFRLAITSKQVLPGTVAEQDEIDALQRADLGQRRGDEFELRLGIEQCAEPDKAQWIAFHHRDSDNWFSGDCCFHSFPL